MGRKSGVCLGLLIVAVAFYWCRRAYKTIDPKAFNDKIRCHTHIKTAQDLIFAYDSTLVRLAADKESFKLSASATGNKRFEITAIVEINDDDELKAEKIVMIAEHKGNFWKVLEIRCSWKYRDGYGHTDWGI